MQLCGATELHAAFREESRTSLLATSAALQEIREAIGLFVVSSKENHTSRSLPGHSSCETALGQRRPLRFHQFDDPALGMIHHLQ